MPGFHTSPTNISIKSIRMSLASLWWIAVRLWKVSLDCSHGILTILMLQKWAVHFRLDRRDPTHCQSVAKNLISVKLLWRHTFFVLTHWRVSRAVLTSVHLLCNRFIYPFHLDCNDITDCLLYSWPTNLLPCGRALRPKWLDVVVSMTSPAIVPWPWLWHTYQGLTLLGHAICSKIIVLHLHGITDNDIAPSHHHKSSLYAL